MEKTACRNKMHFEFFAYKKEIANSNFFIIN